MQSHNNPKLYYKSIRDEILSPWAYLRELNHYRNVEFIKAYNLCRL